MKRTSVFLISFFVLFLSANAKKGQPLKIGDATVQHWVAGMPNGLRSGHGDHYQIKLYVKTSKLVDFTNLWVGGKSVVFRLETFTSTPPRALAYGDSIILDYNTADGEAQPTAPVPVNYKGAAIIKCTIAGKAYYFVVKQFMKLSDYIGL